MKWEITLLGFFIAIFSIVLSWFNPIFWIFWVVGIVIMVFSDVIGEWLNESI